MSRIVALLLLVWSCAATTLNIGAEADYEESLTLAQEEAQDHSGVVLDEARAAALLEEEARGHAEFASPRDDLKRDPKGRDTGGLFRLVGDGLIRGLLSAPKALAHGVVDTAAAIGHNTVEVTQGIFAPTNETTGKKLDWSWQPRITQECCCQRTSASALGTCNLMRSCESEVEFGQHMVDALSRRPDKGFMLPKDDLEPPLHVLQKFSVQVTLMRCLAKPDFYGDDEPLEEYVLLMMAESVGLQRWEYVLLSNLGTMLNEYERLKKKGFKVVDWNEFDTKWNNYARKVFSSYGFITELAYRGQPPITTEWLDNNFANLMLPSNLVAARLNDRFPGSMQVAETMINENPPKDEALKSLNTRVSKLLLHSEGALQTELESIMDFKGLHRDLASDTIPSAVLKEVMKEEGLKAMVAVFEQLHDDNSNLDRIGESENQGASEGPNFAKRLRWARLENPWSEMAELILDFVEKKLFDWHMSDGLDGEGGKQYMMAELMEDGRSAGEHWGYDFREDRDGNVGPMVGKPTWEESVKEADLSRATGETDPQFADPQFVFAEHAILETDEEDIKIVKICQSAMRIKRKIFDWEPLLDEQVETALDFALQAIDESEKRSTAEGVDGKLQQDEINTILSGGQVFHDFVADAKQGKDYFDGFRARVARISGTKKPASTKPFVEALKESNRTFAWI